MSTNIPRPSRAAEGRDVTPPTSKVRWTPPNQLPNADPHPDLVYHWCALSVYGDADVANMSYRTAEGWTPVTPQEQPRVAAACGVPASASTIDFGGLQLRKMPKELHDSKMEYYANLNGSQVNAKSKFRTEASPIVASMPISDQGTMSSGNIGVRRPFGNGE